MLMARGSVLRGAGAVTAALVWASGCGLAEVEEQGGRPGTWLTWLYSVRIAGRPLVTSEAALAFAWSLAAVLMLTIIAVVGTRRLSLRPRGLQTLLELLVGSLRSIIERIMGPRGVEFLPFVGALFIYIAFMNLLTVVPGFMAPTSNLSITAGLALVVFGVVQYYGLKEQGAGYIKHFVEGVPLQFPYLLLAPLVFLIHFIAEIFRPITLAIRLFGNLMAGHTVIFVLIGLVVGLLRRYLIPIPVQLPNLVLEVLVSIVQAAIFSMLTAVYLDGVLHHAEHTEGG